MNRYLLDRLSRERDEARGGRGGNRGGNRGGRDRGDYMDDYDERGYGRGDSESSRRGGSQNRGGSQRGGQSSRSNRGGGRDMRYDDYDDYQDFEYNDGKEMELSEHDIKKWEKRLDNADGSHGAKFHKDQIIPIAKQYGIEFKEDKFTEDEFVLTVNMLYSDFCEALQKASLPSYSRPEPYVLLAKAFLCDDDFEGKPYEKLAVYYYAIVEYDD